jgi:hypothetical protein
MLGLMAKIISFGRKPKFKQKLNLNISCRSNRLLEHRPNGTYINWKNAMTSHVSVKNARIPNANQLDQYAVATSNVIRFDNDSSPIKIDNC